MTPAQRMVRARGWRWLPGVLGVDVDGRTFRVIAADVLGPTWIAYTDGVSRPVSLGSVPDTTDPATLGAIEHGLLGPAGWRIISLGSPRTWCAHRLGAGLSWRDTLAEALADAVEAL